MKAMNGAYKGSFQKFLQFEIRRRFGLGSSHFPLEKRRITLCELLILNHPDIIRKDDTSKMVIMSTLGIVSKISTV